MKTLVKQGWGADNPAFRQIFTSMMMPTATKEQEDAFNDLQRLSGSPECAVRYLETVADLDVRELLSQVKVPTLVIHVRDEAIVPINLGRELAAGYRMQSSWRYRARIIPSWSRTPACLASSTN